MHGVGPATGVLGAEKHDSDSAMKVIISKQIRGNACCKWNLWTQPSLPYLMVYLGNSNQVLPPLGSHQQLSNKLTHIQKTHKSRLGHCSHPLPTEQAPGPANQGISMVKMLPMCWLCIYKLIYVVESMLNYQHCFGGKLYQFPSTSVPFSFGISTPRPKLPNFW